MTGILFTGGAMPAFSLVRKEIERADLIVAADSGFDSAMEMNIKPDIVIGDMDSIRHTNRLAEYSDDKVFRFSEDKDETDTELGLNYLYERKFDRIILLGGGAGRMDHFLGIFFLFEREKSPDIWYTHNTRFQKITGDSKIFSIKGQKVSFFPIGKIDCRMRSNGLKWPLDNLLWTRGDMGISNIVTENPFSIEMIEGRLIMVSQLKEIEY